MKYQREVPQLRIAFARVRTPTLTVAGLSLLSAAAWTLATGAGLAAAGLSCLAVEFLSNDKE